MLLVEHAVQGCPIPTLVVADTKAAMATLARAHREHLGPTPVIGITGSCGKTTVKNMLQQVLSELGPICASQRSFNNDIGLPLTLLSATARDRAVVLEMGTNSPGEIAHLADTAQPDYGIVTMIGTGHLEGLESVEGIARIARPRAVPQLIRGMDSNSRGLGLRPHVQPDVMPDWPGAGPQSRIQFRSS